MRRPSLAGLCTVRRRRSSNVGGTQRFAFPLAALDVFDHGPRDRATVCFRICHRINCKYMKRQLIAVILLLALGLQSSLAAYSATWSLMSTDCQTMQNSQTDASHDSCCPKGQHAINCCLDLCFASVGITVFQAIFVWKGRSAPALAGRTSIFSSRGDSPLIRPPIP